MNVDEQSHIKIITIGKYSVGKSTLLQKYVNDKQQHAKPTIAIDTFIKKMLYNNKKYTFELYDSAGHERYRSIVYNYFRDVRGAIVVFDLTEEESLEEAKIWLRQLLLHCGENLPLILIGNKSDALTEDELNKVLQNLKQKINEIKMEYKCQYFVVSAKTGMNLSNSMQTLFKAIIQRQKPLFKESFKLSVSTVSDVKRKLNKKMNCC